MLSCLPWGSAGVPAGANWPWVRLHDPDTSGGGYRKVKKKKPHWEKYNHDTLGWLLSRSSGRRRGQGGIIPEHVCSPAQQPALGISRGRGRLGTGKRARVFLQPLLGPSPLLGDAEQPFPSREEAPWPSAVAKTTGKNLSSIPPPAAAQHCLQLAAGMKGWQAVTGTLLPGTSSFSVPSGLFLFPWTARGYLHLGLREEHPARVQPAFVW